MGENLFHKLLSEERQNILNDSSIPQFIKNQVKKILDCRTIDLGGHVYYCPDAHGGLIFYNSCKKRGCSVCMEYEQRKWFLKKNPLLFPVCHHHLVFKIPAELTSIWLYNKRLIPKIMFASSSEAIKKVNKKNTLNRGWISLLHTWGGDLSYHPHLHVLITDGGLDKNLHWDEKSLKINDIKIYYDEIIRKKIHKELKKNKLLLPPGIDSEEIKKIVNKKTFYVNKAGLYENGTGVLNYISKKLKIGAFDHRQIISYDSETVTFYYKRGEKKEVIKLKRKEFIRRYLNHIPPKGFVLVRSSGIYSTRQQAKTKELKVKLFNVKEEEYEYKGPVFYCPICNKELSNVVKYSKKELKWLFKKMKLGYPERPPPEHKEFVKNLKHEITQ
jgi:hypothetical protein